MLRILLLSPCLAIAACFLDPGACTYEHRSLVLDGTLTAESTGTPGTIAAAVALNETRNSGADFRVLNLVIDGSIANDVAVAELLDATTDPASALAVWPDFRSNTDIELTTASPSRELLVELARAGTLRLAILMQGGGTPGGDAPGRAAGALYLRENGDWMHPRCD